MDERDELEYQKALEVLNSSSRSRIKKKLADDKKSKKAKNQRKWNEMSFIEKCKADIVIPICLILAVLAVIGAVLYFVIPSLKKDKTPNIGIKYSDLQQKVPQSEMFTLLAQVGFEIPDTKFIANENDSNTEIFSQSISNQLGVPAGIEGVVRKSDGKITELRILMGPNSGLDSEVFMQVRYWYFGSYLQVLYPDLTEDEIKGLVNYATLKPDYYTLENSDLALRGFTVIQNGVQYFGIMVIPADSLDDYLPSESVADSAA